MKYVYSLKEISEQKKLDTAERDSLWAALAKEAGGGEKGQAVADAMRKFYSMYDSTLVDWSATLYDKGHGAYYTASVGRDTDGFLPDVESTVQMLRFLDGSGLMRGVGGSWIKALPEWMIYQMVYYSKSLQDENGFFYYSNWAKETADEMISRRARDVGWCTNLLTVLGEKPMYDAPNGVEGGGSDPEEYWASLGVDYDPPAGARALYQKRLSENVAMSKAETEAAAQRSNESTAYLKSHTAFVDYMDQRLIPGMKQNPYFYGNEVGETYRQVGLATKKLGAYSYKESDGERYKEFDGMTVSDIMISMMDGAINPETGMWGDLRPQKPTGKEFLYTNGFMKGMAAYNGLGYPYPSKYLMTVANSLMDSLLGDEPSVYNICEVYNSWTSVCRLRENLAFVKDEKVKREVVAAFEDILIAKAPEAILNSYEKIKGYKKADGGFSHSYYNGTPDHQGLPISTRENCGDVDATCIGSTGVTRVMFEALGLTRVPILMHSDWMRYRNILENLTPVVKTKTQNPLIDYEDGLTRTSYTINGASCGIEHFGSSRALKVRLHGKDQALRVTYTAHTPDGEFYLFESDITVSDAEDGASFDIQFTNAKAQIPIFAVLKVSGSNLMIGNEEYGMSEYKKIGELGKTITLRMEYTTHKGSLSSILDIYANGSRIGRIVNEGSEESTRPSGYPAKALTSMRFVAKGDSESVIYFDNVMLHLAKRN